MTQAFSGFQREKFLYTPEELHTVNCYISLFAREYELLFTKDLFSIIAQYFAKSYKFCIFKISKYKVKQDKPVLFYNNIHLNAIKHYYNGPFDVCNKNKNKNIIDTNICKNYCFRIYFNNPMNDANPWEYLYLAIEALNTYGCHFGIYIHSDYIECEAQRWTIDKNENAKFLVSKSINQFDMLLDFNKNELKYKLIDDNKNREYIFEKKLENSDIQNIWSTKWILYGTVYKRIEIQIANINPDFYGKYKDLVQWPALYTAAV